MQCSGLAKFMCANDIYFLRQIDGVLGLGCPQTVPNENKKENILWLIWKRFINECWKTGRMPVLISTDRLISTLRQRLQQTLTIILIYVAPLKHLVSCSNRLWMPERIKLWAVKIQRFFNRWDHFMVLLTFIFLRASWSVQIGLFLGSLWSRLCCASEICRVCVLFADSAVVSI